MALLKVKLDVYPLENYIQNPPVSASANPNPSHHHHHHGGGGGSAKQRGGGSADGEPRHHKTPLEKLITLKARCREEQCVQSAEAVLIAHLHRHPHIILLKQPQQPNQGGKGGGGGGGGGGAAVSGPGAGGPGVTGQRVVAGRASTAAAGGAGDFIYRLPGGRCRRGETEEACLHRKLGRQLLNEPKLPPGPVLGSSSSGAAGGDATDTIVDVGSGGGGAHTSEAANYFRIGDVLSKWYRPHFSPLLYPYVPPHIPTTNVKEVRSIFLVHLEPTVYFHLYREDTELVAVPLFELYENTGKYGPILASLPVLLSRVLINYCSTDY